MKPLIIILLTLWSISGMAYWLFETVKSLDNEVEAAAETPSLIQVVAYGPACWVLYICFIIALHIIFYINR